MRVPGPDGPGRHHRLLGARGQRSDTTLDCGHGGYFNGDHVLGNRRASAANLSSSTAPVCLSACTLAIGLLPRGQVCATPKAILGFHAAWRRTPNGGRVTAALATRVMYELYPANVRKWISRHGGLSGRLILLKGRELAAMVPACDAGPAIHTPPRRARSGRDYFPVLVAGAADAAPCVVKVGARRALSRHASRVHRNNLNLDDRPQSVPPDKLLRHLPNRCRSREITCPAGGGAFPFGRRLGQVQLETTNVVRCGFIPFSCAAQLKAAPPTHILTTTPERRSHENQAFHLYSSTLYREDHPPYAVGDRGSAAVAEAEHYARRMTPTRPG